MKFVDVPGGASLMCIVCNTMRRNEDLLADLDGVAYRSYVCKDGNCTEKYVADPERFNGPARNAPPLP